MAINVYTGLMGSGKSYEVVASVIVPAIEKGRRIVTNIDGINEKEIHKYILKKNPDQDENKLGKIIQINNDDIPTPDFLPHSCPKLSKRKKPKKIRKKMDWSIDQTKRETAQKHRAYKTTGHRLTDRNWWWSLWVDQCDTIGQPGDLICIDEAWRFWGTDCKLIAEHKIFFREHRHYVHPETKTSCDLVLMVQDISDLHRNLKVVVELSFRTHKKKSLGLHKTYSVQMWEGYKQFEKNVQATQVKKYDKNVFPLYQSYAGGKGNEIEIDKRQNILKRPIIYIALAFIPIGGTLSAYGLYNFFTGKPQQHQRQQILNNTLKRIPPGALQQKQLEEIKKAAEKKEKEVSTQWRLIGTILDNGKILAVIKDNETKTIRIASPEKALYENKKMVSVTIDGEKITPWSGRTNTNPLPAVPTPKEDIKK